MILRFSKGKDAGWPVYDPHDRINIPDEIIEAAQRVTASPSYCSKVWDRFYADYPRKPFISRDRELYTLWFQEMSGSSSEDRGGLVKLEMMVPDVNGLLPGHRKMLEWLQRPKKRIPSYFEYEYGINFTDEENWLRDEGYLNDRYEPTDKAFRIVPKRVTSVKEISPALGAFCIPLFAFNDTPFRISESDRIPFHGDPRYSYFRLSEHSLAKVEEDLNVINALLKSASVKLECIKGFAVFAHDFCLKNTNFALQSYIIYVPFTKTGKRPKNTYSVQYYYPPDDDLQFPELGAIRYKSSGAINSADLYFWVSGNLFSVFLRSVKSVFYISKVDFLEGKTQCKKTLFDVRDVK